MTRPADHIPMQNARIEWRDDGLPFSPEYGDIFFSSHDPAGETHHVFLQHNGLPRRWQQSTSRHFTIAETGFGFGLNFLCTWALWEQTAPPGSQLHYVSTEKHPLQRADLQRAQTLWPQLADYGQRLLAQYPDHSSGIHRLRFAGSEGRLVTLTLAYGEAESSLATLCQPQGWRVDAWFLDGFAPSRNPAMWSSSLCQRLADLSAPGCTLATYTVAGLVRRNLADAGFRVEKVSGHGSKRQMLQGIFDPAIQNPDRPKPGSQPLQLPASKDTERHAIIIGAGLAGCSSAHALAMRGWQVTLLEREAQVASRASGNPQGILHLKLSKQMHAGAAFNLHAYLFALRHYLDLQTAREGEDFFHPCPLLQLGFDARSRDRLNGLLTEALYPPQLVEAVDAQQASLIAGIAQHHGGVLLHGSAWLQPKRLCQAYLQHPAIRLHCHRHALRLTHKDEEWQVWGQEPSSRDTLLAKAPVLILANSREALAFSQSQHYPLGVNSGQISLLQANQHSQALQAIICSKGYILPAHQGRHCMGGSFVSGSTDTQLDPAQHQVNLAFLSDLAPGIFDITDEPQICDGRRALRCSSPDHFPLSGPVEDVQSFDQHFAALARDASIAVAGRDCSLPGLFVNTAHGSHGLTNTPLCAEYLASLIDGSPLPLCAEHVQLLHPARFLLRAIKRQQHKTGETN